MVVCGQLLSAEFRCHGLMQVRVYYSHTQSVEHFFLGHSIRGSLHHIHLSPKPLLPRV